MAVQLKYARPCPRNEYGSLVRHPVVLVGYNSFDVNAGGMIRTAEAFRIEKVYLAKKPQKRAAAVATDKWQPLEYTPYLEDVIRQLKGGGYIVVGLEQTDVSVKLPDTALPERMVLVVGNEGNGIPPRALALCDYCVEIPQFGFVGSLNVVTAASIALYEWVRQHAC